MERRGRKGGSGVNRETEREGMSFPDPPLHGRKQVGKPRLLREEMVLLEPCLCYLDGTLPCVSSTIAEALGTEVQGPCLTRRRNTIRFREAPGPF